MANNIDPLDESIFTPKKDNEGTITYQPAKPNELYVGAITKEFYDLQDKINIVRDGINRKSDNRRELVIKEMQLLTEARALTLKAAAILNVDPNKVPFAEDFEFLQNPHLNISDMNIRSKEEIEETRKKIYSLPNSYKSLIGYIDAIKKDPASAKERIEFMRDQYNKLYLNFINLNPDEEWDNFRVANNIDDDPEIKTKFIKERNLQYKRELDSCEKKLRQLENAYVLVNTDRELVKDREKRKEARMETSKEQTTRKFRIEKIDFLNKRFNDLETDFDLIGDRLQYSDPINFNTRLNLLRQGVSAQRAFLKPNPNTYYYDSPELKRLEKIIQEYEENLIKLGIGKIEEKTTNVDGKTVVNKTFISENDDDPRVKQLRNMETRLRVFREQASKNEQVVLAKALGSENGGIKEILSNILIPVLGQLFVGRMINAIGSKNALNSKDSSEFESAIRKVRGVIIHQYERINKLSEDERNEELKKLGLPATLEDALRNLQEEVVIPLNKRRRAVSREKSVEDLENEGKTVRPLAETAEQKRVRQKSMQSQNEKIFNTINSVGPVDYIKPEIRDKVRRNIEELESHLKWAQANDPEMINQITEYINKAKRKLSQLEERLK